MSCHDNNMIENSESEESGSENELNDQEKIKLDPVKAENLKNGFTFGTTLKKDPVQEAYKKTQKQIYILLSRCIAYPFTTKQASDRGYRYMNINEIVLTKMKDKFKDYLDSPDNISSKDAVFIEAVNWFFSVFLMSKRAIEMTKSGGYTTKDFQHVFKKKIYQLVCQLPDDQEYSRMELLSEWITEYDEIVSQSSEEHDRRVTNTEGQLNKNQLYTLFQKILEVTSYEHKLLFNAMQLNNNDEQTAAVRRELENRSARVNSGERPPYLFIHHDMAAQYREEERKNVRGLQDKHTNPMKDMNQMQFDGSDKVGKSLPCKHDFVLNFNVEVEVMEVKGLPGIKGVQPERKAFCAMDIEGQTNKVLCTHLVSQKNPVWTNKAEFQTKQPLPSVRVCLRIESNNPLYMEGRPIGEILFKMKPETLSDKPKWDDLEAKVEVGQGGVALPNQAFGLQIKTCVKMDKPENMKLGGLLYIRGTSHWQKWKQRYIVLVKVGQIVFCLCSYKEKQATPNEMLTLEGYTVNYYSPDHQDCEEDAKFQFRLLKEGEEVTCGAKDSHTQQLWVNALYRATGQTTRPEKSDNIRGNDVNDIRKAGLDMLISKEPCKLDQDFLFRTLQHLTLEYRIKKESTACRGWLSTGQEFALMEYAERYGIRYLTVHLSYLKELVNYAEKGFVIDPNKFRDLFKNCCNYIQGKTSDDGVWTVTKEEFLEFHQVRAQLKTLLMQQITHFRNSFPFGRPDNALKTTIKLLEQVLTHKIELKVDLPDLLAYEEEEMTSLECRKQTMKCLEQGAYINYLQISQQTLRQLNMEQLEAPGLDDMIQLADACIEFLQETLEHYGEALNVYDRMMYEMNETFWRLYGVDMESVLVTHESGSRDILPLFHKLNAYFYEEQELRYGKFHMHLHQVFAPHIVSYLEKEESTLREELEDALERETWLNENCTEDFSCCAVLDIVAQVKNTQKLVAELRWPDKTFSEHLQSRTQKTTAEIFDCFVSKVYGVLQTYPRLQRNVITYNSVLPDEVCVMMNSCITVRIHANELCGNATNSNSSEYSYRTEINDLLTQRINVMFEFVCTQLSQCLDILLDKLSRYDKDSIFSHLYTIMGPKMAIVEPLFSYVRQNNVQMKQEIHPSSTSCLLLCWYNSLLTTIADWLTERENIDMHHFQLCAISTIFKTLFSEFSSQGLTEEQLRNATYRMIHNRIEYEETMNTLNIDTTRNYAYGYSDSSESESAD